MSTSKPPITDDQIRSLRREAAIAGDSAQVRMCDAALSGDEDAALDCIAAIDRAADMDDDDAPRPAPFEEYTTYGDLGYYGDDDQPAASKDTTDATTGWRIHTCMSGRPDGLWSPTVYPSRAAAERVAKADARGASIALCVLPVVAVPAPADDGVMVDWIEGGARRRGRLHRGGGRRWLALEGLRPLYVTDDEADDIIAGSPKLGGDFNLLWDASHRDERLAARKAAAAAKMEAEAQALLDHAKAMRGE